MKKLIERLLRFFRRNAVVIAPAELAPETEIEIAPPARVAGEYTVLPSGKIIFPIATDKNGKPIKFERGVNYIVGSNGHWRKQRVPRPEQKGELQTDPLEKTRGTKTKKEYAKLHGIEYKHQNRFNTPLVKPKDIVAGKTLEERRMYNLYRRMFNACYDEQSYYYPAVGAKGGTVCEEWRTSYKAFTDYVEQMGYQIGKSLRRIDDTKPFGPGNVKYVDASSAEAGHENSKRKFTDMEIKHIRVSPQSVTGLASLYNVNTGTISQIRSRKTYKLVE